MEQVAFRKHQGRTLLHVVHTKDPHPSSFAASLLLQEYYKDNDEHWEENRHSRELCKAGRLNYTVIKNLFFRRLIKSNRRLVCELCGRNDLFYRNKLNKRYTIGTSKKRGRINSLTVMAENLATIDHIIPLANGGLKYSFSNMMCLCGTCNVLKGSRSVIKIDGRYVLNG